MMRHLTAVAVCAAVASALMLKAPLAAQAPAIPPAASQGNRSGAMSEGFTVHGQWTIDIREPDGTLVSHHAFTNALVVANAIMPGNALIAGLLSRRWTQVGEWIVVLGGTNGPCGTPAAIQICEIAESTYRPSDPSPSLFRTLALTAPTTPVNFGPIGTWNIPTGAMSLSGHATAALASTINTVATHVALCPPASTGSCFLGRSLFTSHTLTTPISVAAGQIMQVTVAFSFS